MSSYLEPPSDPKVTPFLCNLTEFGGEVTHLDNFLENNWAKTGYPQHRENRENGPKKILIRENTGNLEILSKHREVCCLSCKFSDPKGKGYCDICRENSHFFIGLLSQFIVFNSYKSCKLAQGKIAVGQGKHREFENTI